MLKARPVIGGECGAETNKIKGDAIVDAVLVNPFPGGSSLNYATVEPPLCVAYIAAVLEQRGFSCSIIDANLLRLNSAQVVAKIQQDTKLIGFYVYSFNYDSVLELVRLCRKSLPRAIVLLGGPLASVIPQRLLADMPCHGVIRGEGEYAVVRILENITKGAVPFDPEVSGAVFRTPEDGEIVTNPVLRIEDLDQLPFPAYHLLPPLKAYKSFTRKRPFTAIVTSRGCPHRCIFCSKDVFDGRITFRSPSNVLAEIDHLVSQFGVRQIDILDDNFAQRRHRVEEILDGLIERNYDLALNFQSGIRTENLDEALLWKMRRSGAYKLAFGIESGDPRVLKMCRKHLDLAKTERIIKSAKKMGFLVYGFFIIGLPGEDEQAFRRTMDFARRADFDVANFCMAIPFIGTELYGMVERNGRFLIDTTRNIDMGFYGGKVFFEYGNAKQEEILDRYKRAYKEFYSLSKKISMLAKVRSWAEFRWYCEAAWTVLRGTVRPSFRK